MVLIFLQKYKKIQIYVVPTAKMIVEWLMMCENVSLPLPGVAGSVAVAVTLPCVRGLFTLYNKNILFFEVLFIAFTMACRCICRLLPEKRLKVAFVIYCITEVCKCCYE